MSMMGMLMMFLYLALSAVLCSGLIWTHRFDWVTNGVYMFTTSTKSKVCGTPGNQLITRLTLIVLNLCFRSPNVDHVSYRSNRPFLCPTHTHTYGHVLKRWRILASNSSIIEIICHTHYVRCVCNVVFDLNIFQNNVFLEKLKFEWAILRLLATSQTANLL